MAGDPGSEAGEGGAPGWENRGAMEVLGRWADFGSELIFIGSEGVSGSFG